jgi:hypothetical protein
MKTNPVLTVFATTLFLISCSSTQTSVVPLTDKLNPDNAYTIVWNGISEAWRYENDQWIRAAEYDYQFNVVQKRYEKAWESVKTLQRLHPDYDGRAGNRDQTMYFEVSYHGITDGEVSANINSSIGNGTGITDNEFRHSVLEIYVKNPSRFMPYNKFRITQNYNYEEGILTEVVELILEKEGIETPFMKNEEKAWFFMKGALPQAPTTFNDAVL